MINDNILDDFEKMTKYNIRSFFEESKYFFYNDYNNFVNFFNGRIEQLDKLYIKRLNYLAEQTIILSNIFLFNKNMMNTIDYWYLLDSFEDIKTKIQTTQNISKYLRSSIVKNNTKSGFVYDYILKREETLENVTNNILTEDDFDNNWINTAFENDLKEIDYDIMGSDKSIKLRKKLFQSNLVTSMIDNTIGEKIYGKDIKRLISFKNNDLETLGYKETVYQTCEILSTIEKGDVPEFPELGINMNFYKGVNMSQLNFPSIIREMRRNFSTDDLFRDFEIKSLNVDNGSIFIEYQVDTKYELVIIKNVTL